MQPTIRCGVLAAAAIVVGVIGGCSDGATTPSSNAIKTSNSITLGDTLSRTLTDSIGPDTLILDADRPLRLHIDLQQTGGVGGGALSYVVVPATPGAVLAGGSSLSSTSSLGPDVADPTLAWFRTPKGGKYFIVVSRSRATYSGGYRIRLFGADPAPEHMPAVLTFGDSGTEKIDRPGDVDEFLLVGHAGATPPVLLLKAETGQPSDTLIVEGVSDAPQQKPIAMTSSADASAFGVASPVTPSSSDTVRIRVRAASGATVGQYRIKWVSVNDAPEGVSADLTVGDTVAASIEFPGDVDVFTFTPDSGRRYALAAQGTGTRSTDHLRFEVRGVAGDSLKLSVAGSAIVPLVSQVTPEFQPKKAITIRVSNEGNLLGPATYRLAILAVDPAPETANELLTYGDTISENLEFKADVDEFTVDASPGDTLIVFAQAISPDTSLRLGIETTGFTGARGLPFTPRLSFAVAPGAPLLGTSTYVIVAVDSGEHTIAVRGMGSSVDGPLNFVGPYRLAVTRVSGAPEIAAQSILPNVVITEDGFPSGEIDRFVFDGTPGQEIAVYTSVFPWQDGASAPLTLRTGTVYFVGASSDSLGWFGTGLRTLVGGPTFIDVQPRSVSGNDLKYRVWVYVVDRSPENAPSTIHIGDVVSEAIYPSADIDEYTLLATPGSHFQACLFNQTATAVNERMGLVIDAGGTASASVTSASGDASPRCSATQTMPAAGSMLLRVLAAQAHGGPYELRIVAVP